MKISRNWLQTYFNDPLPDASTLADALTFHVFEIDGIDPVKPSADGHGASPVHSSVDFADEPQDWVLDVKVTANRGHDCLCHLGIAKEISAILDIPLKAYPHSMKIEDLQKKTDAVAVSIESPELCSRYMAGYIRGVKVGPSPDWLRASLEAIGQRSINNVVDATNYVMFNIGQPLHAFDAGKLTSSEVEPRYAISVRRAREGEKLVALDEKEYTLANSMLVITDTNVDVPIGIAGVKGGMPAGISEATTDIIIESANFNGASVRKTAQVLKLRTDASARFEQGISAELAAYGMRAVVELIVQLAGGEVVGFVDQYPIEPQKISVSVSTSRINTVLGSSLKDTDVTDALRRLGLSSVQEGEVFTVRAPFERLDITIPEDLIEEVGRIIGYDKVPNTELPPLPNPPLVNPNFYAAEKIREELISQDYSEVFTSVFADKGERVIANKIDGVRPYLRNNLTDGLTEALKKNIPNKDLLGLKIIKLFEIGTIWHKDSEETVVATIGEKEQVTQRSLGEDSDLTTYDDLPLSTAIRYQSFSRYPSVVRDIALWTPAGTNADDVLALIRQNAGELLVRSEKFDEFTKGDRTSYAFRLVFQSFERTLTDIEVNTMMESVSTALRARGFEIR